MATTKETQTEEIASLKDSFQGQVKVISDIGDFSHVVTLLPSDTGLQVKFQLTNEYPQSKPYLSVRCANINADIIHTLTSHLDTIAESKIGKCMMLDLMEECLHWLKNNNVDISSKECTKKTQGKKSGKGKNVGKKHPQKKLEEEPDMFIKKPPMKTAADVIKRLQWDESIDMDLFIVGYMDRLTGLEEKAFTAFTWEDLATVDQFCLAIPQHRIQYFKYKDEKVWDKNERLDNVFGSTGSHITIVEAVQKYEDRLTESEKVPECEGADVTKGANVTEGTDKTDGAEPDTTDHAKEIFMSEQQEEQSIEGAECSPSSVHEEEKQQQQQQLLQQYEQEQHQSEQQQQEHQQTKYQRLPQQQQKYQPRHKRPNYFAAFEINNEDLVNKLTEVQRDFLKVYPQYSDYKIPRNGFHLTLNVFSLDGPIDIAKCQKAMEDAKSEITAMAQRADQLTFTGLDHFSSKVIFAKVKCPQELRQIANTISFSLQDQGFDVELSFVPHLTLFKVNRSSFRDPSWRSQNLSLPQFAERQFGHQSIDNIQICKMGTLPSEEEATKASSFYRNIVRFKIDNNQ